MILIQLSLLILITGYLPLLIFFHLIVLFVIAEPGPGDGDLHGAAHDGRGEAGQHRGEGLDVGEAAVAGRAPRQEPVHTNLHSRVIRFNSSFESLSVVCLSVNSKQTSTYLNLHLL